MLTGLLQWCGTDVMMSLLYTIRTKNGEVDSTATTSAETLLCCWPYSGNEGIVEFAIIIGKNFGNKNVLQ